MMRPRLVLCSGVDLPEHSPLRRDRRVVEFDALGPDANTHLRLENVTDEFETRLPGRLVDLLEIAAYVYTADCEASRELAWVDDKSTEPWTRDFSFIIPVRDLALWLWNWGDAALATADWRHGIWPGSSINRGSF